MICDVDHVIINLIKLRNEKMKNEHSTDHALEPFGYLLFISHLHHPCSLMVYVFQMCSSTSYLNVHSYIYMCVLFTRCDIIIYGK